MSPSFRLKIHPRQFEQPPLVTSVVPHDDQKPFPIRCVRSHDSEPAPKERKEIKAAVRVAACQESGDENEDEKEPPKKKEEKKKGSSKSAEGQTRKKRQQRDGR